MKGRKPIPSAVRLLRGNPGRRPLKNSVKLPVETLPAPDFLKDHALEKWNQLEPVLRGAGIVTVADADALAAYCSAYGEWRDAETIMREIENPSSRFLAENSGKSGARLIKNPMNRCRVEARAEMMRFAAELGITPSARTKVSPVTKPDRPNKFTSIPGLKKGE